MPMTNRFDDKIIHFELKSNYIDKMSDLFPSIFSMRFEICFWMYYFVNGSSGFSVFSEILSSRIICFCSMTKYLLKTVIQSSINNGLV